MNQFQEKMNTGKLHHLIPPTLPHEESGKDEVKRVVKKAAYLLYYTTLAFFVKWEVMWKVPLLDKS